jgi:hypothetical protein
MRFFVIDTRAVIGGPFETQATPVGPERQGDAPRCPVCGEYIGLMPWLPPYRVKLRAFGGHLGDVAYCVPDMLFSERFRAGFEGASLTGLEFHPVEITQTVPKRLSPQQRYFFAAVPRGRAAIDVQKSGFERGPVQCAECRRMMQVERASRIVLEDGTWDGLDIFTARGLPGTRIVSERFKAMCEREQITGLMLKPADEYDFDGMPWTKDPPGAPTSFAVPDYTGQPQKPSE